MSSVIMMMEVFSFTSLANCSSSSFDLSSDGDFILNLYSNNSLGTVGFDNSGFKMDYTGTYSTGQSVGKPHRKRESSPETCLPPRAGRSLSSDLDFKVSSSMLFSNTSVAVSYMYLPVAPMMQITL